jgi:hypothetical protein
MHCPNGRLMNHVLISKIQIVGGMHHLYLDTPNIDFFPSFFNWHMMKENGCNTLFLSFFIFICSISGLFFISF